MTATIPFHSARYFEHGLSRIWRSDVLDLYDQWESPTIIISDGAYGVSGFPGDTMTPNDLADWYEPHVACWTKKSTPETTLWFWNTEIGWANTHSILQKYGWVYRGLCIWDKGVAHIAGNVNTQSIRRVPPVTEVCAHYVREATFFSGHKEISMKEWLRKEWTRTGLPLTKTNEACGVKNAATRKYFTQCHLWYYPPVELFEKIVDYANTHGHPEGRPYFTVDGKKSLTGYEWSRMRSKFKCEHGVTNVWREPAVRGTERIKAGNKALHMNQKPICLLEQVIRMTSDEGDLVWEPFGGLCSVSLASARLSRRCVSAEILDEYYDLAINRFDEQSPGVA